MENNFTELTIHLINGEDIHVTSLLTKDSITKLLDDYMNDNVHYLRVNYDQGAIAYLDKVNILYIEEHHEMMSFNEMKEAVESYNENE